MYAMDLFALQWRGTDVLAQLTVTVLGCSTIKYVFLNRKNLASSQAYPPFTSSQTGIMTATSYPEMVLSAEKYQN